MSLSQSEGGQEAAGFVLAGGQSSRMGKDKALLEFSGELLIVRALTILREAGLQPAIAGARGDLSGYAPVIDDSTAMGPLSGICAALSATTARYGVFLPVDLPFIPSSLVSYMLFHARLTDSLITVAAVSGIPETFPAVIDRQALPFLESRLRSEERGCLDSFQHAAKHFARRFSILQTELLVQARQIPHPASLPPALWFLNLNSSQDLMRAQKLATGFFE